MTVEVGGDSPIDSTVHNLDYLRRSISPSIIIKPLPSANIDTEVDENENPWTSDEDIVEGEDETKTCCEKIMTPYRLHQKFQNILGGSNLINYNVAGIEALDKKDKGLLE